MTPRSTTTFSGMVRQLVTGSDLPPFGAAAMRQSIDQLRGEIKDLEKQIQQRQLAASNPRTNLLNLSSEIYGLEEMIKQKRRLIEQIEIQLRTQEAIEQAAADLEAQAKAKADEAARLEAAQREATARAAALSAWIDANGSSAGFEAAWPTIKQQIAREAATQAAATSLESGGVDQANAAAYATKILTAKYGGSHVNNRPR